MRKHDYNIQPSEKTERRITNLPRTKEMKVSTYIKRLKELADVSIDCDISDISKISEEQKSVLKTLQAEIYNYLGDYEDNRI